MLKYPLKYFANSARFCQTFHVLHFFSQILRNPSRLECVSLLLEVEKLVFFTLADFYCYGESRECNTRTIGLGTDKFYSRSQLFFFLQYSRHSPQKHSSWTRVLLNFYGTFCFHFSTLFYKPRRTSTIKEYFPKM